MLVSIEADVLSLLDPADSDLIDGTIGEGSPFHQTFGYYAHRVSEETAILPTGYHDLISKLAEQSGVHVVLNTSFNENEPVVDTPAQAVACFQRTDMDVLCLGPFVTTKSGKSL